MPDGVQKHWSKIFLRRSYRVMQNGRGHGMGGKVSGQTGWGDVETIEVLQRGSSG